MVKTALPLNNRGCRSALLTLAGFLFLLLFNFANTSAVPQQMDVALTNFSDANHRDNHTLKIHHELADHLDNTLSRQQRRFRRGEEGDDDEATTTTEVTDPVIDAIKEGDGKKGGNNDDASEAEQKANCQDESAALFNCLCAAHGLLSLLSIAVLVYFCMLRSQTNAAIAYIMGEENGYGGGVTMMGRTTMGGGGTKMGGRTTLGGSKLGKTTTKAGGGAGTTMGRTTKGGGALTLKGKSTLKGGPKTKGGLTSKGGGAASTKR